jgi:protein phosphatase 1 regulatory subunit 42
MSVVKISNELLARCPSHTKRKRGESLPDYLRRLTHLYLQEKGIEEIDNLHTCRNLAVLYLYDNSISRLENLEPLTNLTHLYLQNNKISRIENISSLRKLTKLYLSGNTITVVEGLDQLTDLRELYVENQQLPSGEKLLFDPRTLVALAHSLNVLNVSGNRLNNLSDFTCLENLTQLIATNNQLTDFKELQRLLCRLTVLWRLELTGNPMCLRSKYRERVTIMSMSLSNTDD